MKVSIENFKSIEELVEYELKPLTIISGINSTGKSSFVQLLLLMKQTIERNSPDEQFFLKGDLYKVKSFVDILSCKNIKNKLKIELIFSKEEDLKINSPKRISIFDSYEDYKIAVSISYDSQDNKPSICEFSVKYILPEEEKREQFLTCVTNKQTGILTVESNNKLFGKELGGNKPIVCENIEYSSIYPLYYEERETETGTTLDKNLFNLDGLKEIMDSTFKSFYYIGPIRTEPQDEYVVRDIHDSVGIYGEFVSQVLENNSRKPIVYFKPTFSESGEVEFTKTQATLLEGVKYWMCDVFKIGRDIFVEKINDVYVINLISENGTKTTIRHVGFGISQVLPIIVEGLIMEDNSTLILEQPEIHLHPKIQSLLFDFLSSLTLQGKKVIVETHSDHFITRMRRRVAEDMKNIMSKIINLTFIESMKGKVLFRSIDVDDFGTIDYFPEDFMEQSSYELKAILNAQLKKQANNK